MRYFFPLRMLVVITLLFTCIQLHAQYYFNKLTEENGLSDNRVTCFLKDKTGFLWIGTKNGLNRYDGASFKIFRPGSGNSISNEVINDIVQDHDGKIWVATVDGLNIYDPLTNKWEVMRPIGSDKKDDLPSYFIWDLAVDELNRIWIVSDVWELTVYDQNTKKFSYFDWPSFKRHSLFEGNNTYRSIQRIERKNKNEWWLGTNIGLVSVKTDSGKFRFYGAGYNHNVTDMEYDSSNKVVFMVTEKGRLFSYDENADQYRELKTTVRNYPGRQWNKRKPVGTSLLMGCQDGMLEINKATSEATLIRHYPNLSSSLLPGGANCVYTDINSIVWVGTNNGVNYCNSLNETTDFIPLTATSDKESVDGMSAAYYDAESNRYLVSSIHTNSLFSIDLSSGAIDIITAVAGRPLTACTNICTDRRGNIWLLTATHVYRYDRSVNQFRPFDTPNNGDDVIFHDFIEDKHGDYWFATWRDGAYVYNTKEKVFRKLTAADSISARSITALVNDPLEDAVWLGTFNTGVYRYDLAKKTMMNYSETPANPDYLQLNLVRDLETDSNGKIWLTTVGAGLYVYQHGLPYERSFSHITFTSGLTHSSYYAAAADDKKRIWLLSGKGLSAIDHTGKYLYGAAGHPVISFANYFPEELYPKRIFYNKSNKELLVPVAGGLLLFYPDKEIPATGFPVVLTDIIVGGRSVIYDSSYLAGKKIEIPYKSNSLTFQFGALHYAKQGNIQYEYKLHEKDKEWKPLLTAGMVDFPDLSSGHYTFMVRAKDAYGHVSSNAASFSFVIKPPFWNTWWFYLLTACFVAVIIYGIYRYQLHKKLEVERLRLRISRDLHDDIGSALTTINVLSKVALNKGGDNSELSGYLSKIKDSTTNTMESMSDIVWAINPKNDKLESLVSRMKEFAADLCEAKEIALDFSVPAELEQLSFDLTKRKNIFLVFKEAVNNAVKYSNCKKLDIRFTKENNQLSLLVKDDGTGFSPDTVHHGNGLRNMKERTMECGGECRIESIPGGGTRVIMELPIPRFGGVKQ